MKGLARKETRPAHAGLIEHLQTVWVSQILLDRRPNSRAPDLDVHIYYIQMQPTQPSPPWVSYASYACTIPKCADISYWQL